MACVRRLTCQVPATCVLTRVYRGFRHVDFHPYAFYAACVGQNPLCVRSWRICFAQHLLRFSAGTLAARQNLCCYCVGNRWMQFLETCAYALCGVVSCGLHGTKNSHNTNMQPSMTVMGGVDPWMLCSQNGLDHGRY